MNRYCLQNPKESSSQNDGRAGSTGSLLCFSRSKSIRFWSWPLFVAMILLGSISTKAQSSAKVAEGATKKPMEPKADAIDSESLPPGYVAPPDRLSIFDLEQPIATKEEMDRLAKDVGKFNKTRSECDLTPAGRKVLEGTIRYWLAEMTLKEKLFEVPQLRKKIVSQVTSEIRGKKPEETKEVTQFIGQSILKVAPELLKNQFHVRLQTIEMLGEIDFAPAYEPLLTVLQSKDIREDEIEGQPEAMKVAAAKSLTRVLRFAQPPAKDRMTIALAVANELEKPDTNWWLQYRLIEALRYSEITGTDPKNDDRQFILEALISVARDPQRNWRVRTRACYALGRVQIPKGTITIDNVVTEVADCALQLANAVAAKPDDPEWKNCVFNIYLAFRKNNTKNEQDSDGLWDKYKTAAQPAYNKIYPIVNNILNGKAPEAGNLRNLSDFMRDRQR